MPSLIERSVLGEHGLIRWQSLRKRAVGGVPIWWVRWTPNVLSALRLTLTPAAALLLYRAGSHLQLGIYVVVAIAILGLFFTDAVDGAWARRLGVETKSGKVLDPVADWVAAISMIWAIASLVNFYLPRQVLGQLVVVGLVRLLPNLAVAAISGAEWWHDLNPQVEAWGRAKATVDVVAVLISIVGFGYIAAHSATPATVEVAGWCARATLLLLCVSTGLCMMSLRPHWKNLRNRGASRASV